MTTATKDGKETSDEGKEKKRGERTPMWERSGDLNTRGGERRHLSESRGGLEKSGARDAHCQEGRPKVEEQTTESGVRKVMV